MTISPPTSPMPTWATDATVDQGADIGKTTRLAPTISQAAQGYLANRKIAARQQNWLLGSICDWSSFSASIGLRSWQVVSADVTSGSSLTIGQLVGSGGRVRYPVQLDSAGTTVGWDWPNPHTIHDPAERRVHSVTEAATRLGCRCLATDGNYVVYGTDTDGAVTATHVLRSTGFGATTGTDYVVDGANASDVYSACSTEADTFFILAGANKCYRSTNGGSSWTAVPYTGFAGAGGLVCGTTDRLVVIPWSQESGAVQAVVTDTEGTSWTTTTVNEAANAGVGLCRVTGGFLSLTDVGSVDFLADGSTTWEHRITHADVADLSGLGGLNIMASDGGVRVVHAAVDSTYESGTIGLYVSTDGGLTWDFVPVSVLQGDCTDVQLAYDGVRFWLSFTQDSRTVLMCSG